MAMTNLKRALAAGAVALTLTVPALAAGSDDNGWGPGWGMGRMMGGWWGGGPGDYASETVLDHVDGRLAFIKAELKITEAQAPAWDALATAVHKAADIHNSLMKGMIESIRNGDFAKMTLPDRVSFQRAHMEARLNEIANVSEALDKLYAALSDDQKKTADAIVLPMMGMGMGFGPGMGFGHGWGYGPGMMQ